jgi:hypothetical protein
LATNYRANDLPLGPTAEGGSLPAFSFVTPNLCHDSHDCSFRIGDGWLRSWLARIIRSAGYQAGNTVLFITSDEDNGSSGNHVAAIVASAYTRPRTRSATAFSGYSLLRTTEEPLGIPTHLGYAVQAPSMRTAFGL